MHGFIILMFRSETTKQIKRTAFCLIWNCAKSCSSFWRNVTTNNNAICDIWVPNKTKTHQFAGVTVTYIVILPIGTNVWALHYVFFQYNHNYINMSIIYFRMVYISIAHIEIYYFIISYLCCSFILQFMIIFFKLYM